MRKAMVSDSEEDLGWNWCSWRWLQALILEESHAWTNITPHLCLPATFYPLEHSFVETTCCSMFDLRLKSLWNRFLREWGLVSVSQASQAICTIYQPGCPVSEVYLRSGWHLVSNRLDTENVLDFTKSKGLTFKYQSKYYLKSSSFPGPFHFMCQAQYQPSI